MTIKQLLNQDISEIINKLHTVSGWVQTVRTSDATFGFCLLNDGSNNSGLQIIISKYFFYSMKFVNIIKNKN